MPAENESIAIIGAAIRFPGANNLREYWRNLCAGVESIRHFSREELRAAGADESLLSDESFVMARGVLGVDVGMFDANFFGFTPREAEITDPQQRLFLECAWEALEDAGHCPERFPGAIGVFAGSGINTYLMSLYTHQEHVEGVSIFQSILANDKDYLPTRVSYKLDLHGPSLAIQTACSTSLVAIHVACQNVLAGECDLALAGGVSILIPQQMGYVYREGGIHSPDGHCRAFDQKARGTVSGDGVGIVVLRRLEEAVADRDNIIAVIRGSAINNDGSMKVGYTAPSVEGQARVVAEALAVAGVDPRSIGYIEAHGTGTALGDPIEVAALKQVFGNGRERWCGLGSVKSNLGHLDTAAGVAGLLKAAMAIREGVIPPTLHIERENPELGLEGSAFYLNRRLQAWKTRAGEKRRAGVSSFGIGGTNAHVVLEEAPPVAATEECQEAELILVSAREDGALREAIGNLAEHLKRESGRIRLSDLSWTLQVGRRSFRARYATVSRDLEEAAEKLSAMAGRKGEAEEGKVRIGWLFPGQGSERAGMGRGLYQRVGIYRETVDRCAEVLKGEMGMDIREVINAEGERRRRAEEEIGLTEIAQPALFTVSYGMARMWESWGVEPAGMLGHSVGEYVAACLAGVMDEEDALRVIAARGRLLSGMGRGMMVAVGIGAVEARELLEGSEWEVAVENGRNRSVIGGGEREWREVEERLKQKGVSYRQLGVRHAFHTSMVGPGVGPMRELMRGDRLKEPQRRYVSNVTGEWAGREVTEAEYWARHLRSAVRYEGGLERMKEAGVGQCVELGAGYTLERLCRAEGMKAVAGLGDGSQDEWETALSAAGQVWVSGVNLKWERVRQPGRRISLPTYPFQRKRHWVNNDASLKTRSKLLTPAAVELQPVESQFMPSVKTDSPESGGS